MPVTTNLLCTANDALDVDFKFAMEHHIPVLPLMQEPGLEELFNKKCGELQFLDKNKIDETAISYEEKLEKYLSSVLIGDELAEKIRAAFNAYVFLSYRKKDRKYAQELMRLIHKNDFCRDITIWYDEFLTPGENFNDSIKDALQKSGLFVLAVTPNLVNETNYIMTTEYPMAREEGKPILPAELVPTDREQLFEKYKDIPTPATKIAKQEDADLEIVQLASLLHDVDDIKLYPETTEQQKNAKAFLVANNVAETKVCRICQIISEISFMGNEPTVPESIEGKCVQDADRLDAIGAIGIARAFAYGGNRNRLIYHPDIQPNMDMGREEYINNNSTTINHFYEKLFKLTALMHTQTAKALAERRELYMKEFIVEFMDEWDGLR